MTPSKNIKSGTKSLYFDNLFLRRAKAEVYTQGCLIFELFLCFENTVSEASQTIYLES